MINHELHTVGRLMTTSSRVTCHPGAPFAGSPEHHSALRIRRRRGEPPDPPVDGRVEPVTVGEAKLVHLS